jgi:hypothetical protein
MNGRVDIRESGLGNIQALYIVLPLFPIILLNTELNLDDFNKSINDGNTECTTSSVHMNFLNLFFFKSVLLEYS